MLFPILYSYSSLILNDANIACCRRYLKNSNGIKVGFRNGVVGFKKIMLVDKYSFFVPMYKTIHHSFLNHTKIVCCHSHLKKSIGIYLESETVAVTFQQIMFINRIAYYVQWYKIILFIWKSNYSCLKKTTDIREGLKNVALTFRQIIFKIGLLFRVFVQSLKSFIF